MKIKFILLLSTFLIINTQNITSQDIHITPRPQKILFGKASLKINSETKIVFNTNSKTIAYNLQKYFKNSFKLNLKTTDFQNLKKNFNAFKKSLKYLQMRWTAKEIYFAPNEFVEKK